MKNQELKLPPNNVSTGLHTSSLRVELNDSTKFDAFSYEHRVGSNLCLTHPSWDPKSWNH